VNDIKRARKAKRLRLRRVARESLVDGFSFSVEMTVPPGLLGWISFVLLLLAPLGLLALAVRIAMRLSHSASHEPPKGAA